jgi:hypothetical protein
VFESTTLDGIAVYDDGVSLSVLGREPAEGSGHITGRLVLDCMGHFSPVVRQVQQDGPVLQDTTGIEFYDDGFFINCLVTH